jgi:HSP20 family protein
MNSLAKGFKPAKTFLSHRNEFVTPFDSLFDELMNSSFPTFKDSFGVDLFGKSAYPKCNIIDKEKSMVIVAEIAGMTKDDIEIEFEDSVLSITGKSRNDESKVDGTIIHRELKHSSFKRSFMLSEKFDTDGIDATFENGLLNITIPKLEPEQSKSKKINIK